MSLKGLSGLFVLALLTACGGGGGGGGAGSPPLSNTAPVANAGQIQNVLAGTVVTLDGSTSFDADGDALTYSWVLISTPAGSAATLDNPSSPKPTFTADIAGTYVASLIVDDGNFGSSPASVTITAAVANAAPVANAGTAQHVVTGATVTLDGRDSSDANGDILSYSWTLTDKPAGSASSLSSSSSPTTTFLADVDGLYTASLVVDDGSMSSLPATVTVTATAANAVPVANAGVSQSAYRGDVVRLDGSSSTDADGDTLTYAWSIQSYPWLFAPAITAADTAQPSFTPRDSGTYVVSLVVNDGRASSAPSTVTITVSDGVGATPDGSGLIVQGSSTFWTLDESTMSQKVAFSCGQAFQAIDRRPDGVIIGISPSQFFELHPVSGVCSALGDTPGWLRAMAVSADGQIVGISESLYTQPPGQLTVRLYKLSSSGASQSYVYLSGASTSVRGIDFGPDGQLYGVGIASGDSRWIVRIDPDTGVTSLAFEMPVTPTLGDIDIDASGVLRTIIDGSLHKLDIATGDLLSTTPVPNFQPGNSLAPIVYVP